MLSETKLLAGARKFDQQALSEIYDRHSDELYRYAMRRLGRADMAEECVAETFRRFLDALRRKKGPQEHLRAYLFRIAHNWIMDYYRRQPAAEEDVDDIVIGQEYDMSHDLDLAQKQQQVRAALAQLTPDQQQVLTLRFYEGWKSKDVAAAIDKPLSSVKALQHRAMASLKRLLLADKEVAK